MSHLIDLVQLRTFIAVAEEQHLTRAAERLHISQSAASAHVRAIEEMYGLQLFVRSSRALQLTASGRLLLTEARSLIKVAVGFTSFASRLSGKTEGKLALGSSAEPISSMLGKIILRLKTDHPLVNVDIYARHSSGARAGLRNGELDAAIFLGEAFDDDFMFYEITRPAFFIAGPVEWKEQIHKADLAELALLPWITPTDPEMAYSVMLRRMFNSVGNELNTVARFDNEAQGRALAQAGVGLTLIHERQAKHGERDGTLAVSWRSTCKHPLLIAYLKARKTDPVIDALVSSVRAVWPESKQLG